MGGATAPGSVRTWTAEPGRTGFREQLTAWARGLTVEGAEPLPGPTDVREDTRVVREAALRLTWRPGRDGRASDRRGVRGGDGGRRTVRSPSLGGDRTCSSWDF